MAGVESQTIIAGTYHAGMEYQFLVENPVKTIDYSTILWPKDIQPPNATRSKRIRTKEREAVCVFDDSSQIQTYSREPNKAADQLLSPEGGSAALVVQYRRRLSVGHATVCCILFVSTPE